MAKSKHQELNENEAVDKVTPSVELIKDSEEYVAGVIDSAMKLPLENVAPIVTTATCSKEEISQIIVKLTALYDLHQAVAFVAIALLFLKGAANKKAPGDMCVGVRAIDGELAVVSKYDLANIYASVTKNKFLRRLAETLATDISKFAEKKNLQGDLAVSINNSLIAEGEPPLTNKEKAWASSFNQKNPLLESEAPRIAKALAIDYQKRFGKIKKVNTAKGAANVAAKTGKKLKEVLKKKIKVEKKEGN